jgi:hypothetical protein
VPTAGEADGVVLGGTAGAEGSVVDEATGSGLGERLGPDVRTDTVSSFLGGFPECFPRTQFRAVRARTPATRTTIVVAQTTSKGNRRREPLI